MAIILRYFAEFGSFRGQLRKSGQLAINRFSPEKCQSAPTKHDGRVNFVTFAFCKLLFCHDSLEMSLVSWLVLMLFK